MDGEAEVVREEDELERVERGEIASLAHRVEFGGSRQRLVASRPRVTSAWSTPHLGSDCQIETIQIKNIFRQIVRLRQLKLKISWVRLSD